MGKNIQRKIQRVFNVREILTSEAIKRTLILVGKIVI